MGGWLSQVAGAPVVVENDANVAALGEALRGAGVGYNPVFYVTLGSGVGGGLVVDGRVYHGAKPGEAEIGHVRLDRNGTIVEARCSGWAVDARIRELKVKEPGSLLARLAGQGGGRGGEAFGRGLATGGPCRQTAFAGDSGGLGVWTFPRRPPVPPGNHHPRRGAVECGRAVARGRRERAAAVYNGGVLPGPRVALAALGEDAVPVGALLLPMPDAGACLRIGGVALSSQAIASGARRSRAPENLPDKARRMVDYGRHESLDYGLYQDS